MGNSVGKLTPCLVGHSTDEHAQHYQRDPAAITAIDCPFIEEGIKGEGMIGQTISFKRMVTPRNVDNSTIMAPFQAIHCVSLGANQLTPSSIMNNDSSFSSSSSFDRSSSFSSFALHPSSSSFSSSDPSYSGILVRSDSKAILREIQAARDRRNQEKLEHPSLLCRFTRAVTSRIKKHKGGSVSGSDVDTIQGTGDEGKNETTLHWAQGKAGEDRVHVVYSEEYEFLFVGIYDGFNGPDAPDFLLANLYEGILLELEGIQWEQHDHQQVHSSTA